MKSYPLGIQTFEKIIDKNHLYIDKTKEIYRLIQPGGYYFYARPRRFGKSLMLSTIKSIYEGKKELFKGLWIEDKWDWSKKHPSIHVGFSGMGHRVIGLEEAIGKELDLIAEKHDLLLKESDYVRKFKELIYRVAEQKGKIILLIDEYDKPIIDYLAKQMLPIQLLWSDI